MLRSIIILEVDTITATVYIYLRAGSSCLRNRFETTVTSLSYLNWGRETAVLYTLIYFQMYLKKMNGILLHQIIETHNRIHISLSINSFINRQNSFANLLGFSQAVYKPGIHTSQNKINISNINTINIKYYLIQGNFYNGIKDNIIYNFLELTVHVGYKIFE